MKTLRYILFAAAGIFAAASCTKEQSGGDIQPTGGVDVKAVFEAVPEDDMSKALLLSNGGLQWESGDEIGVYQYGWYDCVDGTAYRRDNTKNIFTSDGTCVFTGNIAEYHPLVAENIPTDKGASYYERYYVVYPANRCTAYGITTGKYTVKIPSSQTGILSDFKNYAIYLGYHRDGTTVEDSAIYDADTKTLTFLHPFTMFCMTPVLKFNVPESLNATKIVVSAAGEDATAVNLAGNVGQIRCDATSVPSFSTAYTEITIENGGAVLSGDVYVVVAPNTNPSAGTFTSSAKTLNLTLSKASGATASLSLPLTGTITSGTIKNLPAIPETVTWDYPEGPGLSAIEINKSAITSTSGSALNEWTRILLTPENTESVISYRSRTSLSELLGATILNEYNTTNGIARSDADTPENFLAINVATEGYKDYTAYACTWILYKNYGFGKAFTDCAEEYTEETTTDESGTETTTKVYTLQPEPDSTFPVDGSYLYSLSFLYDKLLDDTSTSRLPQISSDGFYLRPSSGTSKNWVGNLRIKSPGTGKAILFFDCYSSDTSRTLNMSINGGTSTTYSTGSNTGYTIIKSGVFEVSADDIIELSVPKANLRFHSITLLWQPTETDETVSTESYSISTSYGE